MSRIDTLLRDAAASVEYPAAPDLATPVLRRINAERPTRSRIGARRLAVAAALAVVVVAVVPGLRTQVAAWLGLRGVQVVETGPLLDAAGRFDLGEPVSVEEAATRAGFTPTVLPELGTPDQVFERDGQIWMLYGASDRLPETLEPGVGAMVTQFLNDEGPGVVKNITGVDAEYLAVGPWVGLWVEGPHELLLPGEGVIGRVAGNTLLWDTDDRTFRLETALERNAALAIASS